MLYADDRAAIDELRERLRRSIVDGDAAAYAACFAEDGVVMHPDSAPVRGRSALSEYGEGMFANVRVSSLRFEPVKLDGDGSFAYEVAFQQVAVEPSLPGFQRDRQHLHVYQRADDGKWYVAVAMSGNR